MTDYDLPSEHRVALRRAKKRISLGTVVVLLAVFVPLSEELGFYRWHHKEIERGERPVELIPPRLLLVVGVIGFAVGLGVVVAGFIEEARAEKKIEAWRGGLR